MVTKAKYETLLAENRSLKARIRALEALFVRRRSKRFVSPDEAQLNLFGEVDEHIEVDASSDAEVPERAVTKHPGRNPLPDHFPLEIEVVMPADAESVEPIDRNGPIDEDELQREGQELIGYETSERVAYSPAQYVRVLQKLPNGSPRPHSVVSTATAPLARSLSPTPVTGCWPARLPTRRSA